MSTYKGIDRLCVIVLVLSLIVTALFMNGEKLGIELVSDTDAEGYAGNEYFTANDLNGSWETSEATVITLSGDAAKISGNGAYWLEGSLKIVQSGQYVISGALTDGNIVVDAADYSKVWILLDGVTLHCSDDACLRVDQADKVFLTLAEGTENTLTSGDAFSETALADGTNAAVFSHDDLTINGSGSLKVVSSYLNGITSKDDLIITGGTISVTAPNHGLRVNDHFRMTSAEVNVSAKQDGIHAEGDVVIQDGTLTITAGDDAIHSDTSVLVLGGTLLAEDCYEGIEALTIEIRGGDTTIHAQDDGLNANGYTGFAFGGGMAMQGQMPALPENMTALPDNMPTDGNGNAVFSQEETALATEQTASEMDETTSVPEETASATDETAEPAQMPAVPSGWGDMGTMVPFEGGPGFEMETQAAAEEKTIVSAEDTWILISGGTLTILNESGMDADGMDSNGNITVTGGRILVSMVGSNGNSALDIGSESGGTAAISGGTLIACGDSSMAEGFGSESTQVSILYALSETAAAGSTMTLLDSEGNTLISEVIPYSFSSVVISCPEMSVGETYTIRIGESEETVEVTDVSVSAGTAAGTGMMPGNMMPGGEGVDPGSFGEGQTPPERPEGEEGFPTPPERPEGEDGFQMPQNGAGFGPPANMQNATATDGTLPAAEGTLPSADGTLPATEGTLPTADGTLPSPEMAQDSSAAAGPAAAGATGSAEAQTAEADSTAAWMLVLVSALVLALGLAVALIYKKSQHIDA